MISDELINGVKESLKVSELFDEGFRLKKPARDFYEIYVTNMDHFADLLEQPELEEQYPELYANIIPMIEGLNQIHMFFIFQELLRCKKIPSYISPLEEEEVSGGGVGDKLMYNILKILVFLLLFSSFSEGSKSGSKLAKKNQFSQEIIIQPLPQTIDFLTNITTQAKIDIMNMITIIKEDCRTILKDLNLDAKRKRSLYSKTTPEIKIINELADEHNLVHAQFICNYLPSPTYEFEHIRDGSYLIKSSFGKNSLEVMNFQTLLDHVITQNSKKRHEDKIIESSLQKVELIKEYLSEHRRFLFEFLEELENDTNQELKNKIVTDLIIPKTKEKILKAVPQMKDLFKNLNVSYPVWEKMYNKDIILKQDSSQYLQFDNAKKKGKYLLNQFFNGVLNHVVDPILTASEKTIETFSERVLHTAARAAGKTVNVAASESFKGVYVWLPYLILIIFFLKFPFHQINYNAIIIFLQNLSQVRQPEEQNQDPQLELGQAHEVVGQAHDVVGQAQPIEGQPVIVEYNARDLGQLKKPKLIEIYEQKTGSAYDENSKFTIKKLISEILRIQRGRGGGNRRSRRTKRFIIRRRQKSTRHHR